MKKLKKAILAVLLVLMVPNSAHAWTWGGAFNSAWNSIKQTSLQTKLLFAGATATIGGIFGLWKLRKKAGDLSKKSQLTENKHQEIIKEQKIKLEQLITKQLIKDTQDIPQVTTDFAKDLSQLNKKVKAEKCNQLKTEAATTIQAFSRGKLAQKNLEQKKLDITTIQSLARKKIAQKDLLEKRKNRENREWNLLLKNKQFTQSHIKKTYTTVKLQSLARKSLAQKDLEQKKLDRSIFDLTRSTVMVQKAPLPDTISLDKLNKKTSWGDHKEDGNGMLITFNKTNILDEVFEKTNNDYGRVRVMYRYTPNKTISNKRMLFTVVHGTFAKTSEEYWYENAKVFKKILEHVQSIADEKNITADIISYQWTGVNDNERITCGKSLAALFNAIGLNYESINTIAHSHGCNVVNSASNHIDDRVATIDTAIHIASPVIEKNHWAYTPGNIKNLYSFYTFHDLVQWLGSFNPLNHGVTDWIYYNIASLFKDTKELKYNMSGRCYAEQQGKNIINFYFKKDGYQPTHTELPFCVMPYAKNIISEYKNNFYKTHKVSVDIAKNQIITMKKTEPSNWFIQKLKNTQNNFSMLTKVVNDL